MEEQLTLNEAKKQLNDLQTENAQLQKTIKEIQLQASQYINELKQENDDLIAKCEELFSACNTQEQMLQSSQRHIKQLKCELDELQDEYTTLQQRLKSEEDKVSQAQIEYSRDVHKSTHSFVVGEEPTTLQLREIFLSFSPAIVEVIDYKRDASIFELAKTFRQLTPVAFSL